MLFLQSQPIVKPGLVGDWRKSGMQMVAIGLGAAALGFLIGRLFHTMGS